MFRPIRTVPPAIEVVTLTEAKLHARIDHSDDDALVETLISAAHDHLDGWAGVLGRCMITQEWRQDFEGWPASRCLRLPFPDVTEVAVTYYDADDVVRTVAPDEYELVESPHGAVVRLKPTFASPSLTDRRLARVSVTMLAGYGPSPADVPKALHVAMFLMVAHWYEQREAVSRSTMSSVPHALDELIAPYRWRRI